MTLGVRELVLDVVKLAVGVLIFSAIDPLTKDLGDWGYVLSLVLSVALTLFFSWLLLNQSAVRFVWADEVQRLVVTGPVHDVKARANSRTTAYRLTLSWEGSGPFARLLTQLAISKADMLLSVDISSSLATLWREYGDGIQPRSAILYQPSSVDDDTWQWSMVTISVDDLPDTSTKVAIKYQRKFRRWYWYWLVLFIHLEPDVKSLRLIRSA